MDVEKYLQEQGYLAKHADPIHREATVHYKKMPGTHKHQLEVVEWPSYVMHNLKYAPSFEVTMTYETQFGAWATTKFYGLNAEKLVEVLPRLEYALKQSMVYMGANPMHYRFDGQD